MEKPRFASFVDLFLEIQVRIEPCPSISCLRNRSNVNASHGKAINIYFGKLLFCTNEHELSFVIVKFELIHNQSDIQRSLTRTASV